MALPISFGSLFGGGPSATSTAALDTSGSENSLGRGDWVINIGGSGTALQSGGTGTINWLLVAAIAGGAWLLLRK